MARPPVLLATKGTVKDASVKLGIANIVKIDAKSFFILRGKYIE